MAKVQILDRNIHYLQLGSGEQYHLTVTSAKKLSMNGGLVFANACSSAGSSVSFNDFQNFGWAFYEAGAEVFIGTLIPVPVRRALDFAKRFYSIWKPNEVSCAEALHIVKQEMSQANNLYWLFYCQYGARW